MRKSSAPSMVVRHDKDDAYLVVAADKGTATFSDIANAISQEYGFWLGDAFASGGSAGYDHKKMAITARGAWECVKRHFREIGVDIQAQNFTVVRHRRHGGRCVRQRHAAIAAHSSGRRVQSSAHFPRSAAAMRRAHSPSANACSSCRAPPGRITRATRFPRAAASIPDPQRTSALSREAQALLVSAGASHAERSHQGHLEGACRSALERRNRHLRQGEQREPQRCRRSQQRCGTRRCARGAIARSSAKAATWACRSSAASNMPAAAAA